MVTLEERIVAGLEALRDAAPEGEGGMLVFPLGLMAGLQIGPHLPGLEVLREGDVALLRRAGG